MIRYGRYNNNNNKSVDAALVERELQSCIEFQFWSCPVMRASAVLFRQGVPVL